MSDSNRLSKSFFSQRGWIWWGLVSLAVVLLAIIALVSVLLATSSGRVYLTQQGLQRVPMPEGMVLTVDQVTSPSFGRWLFGSLQVSLKDESLMQSDALVHVNSLELSFDLGDLLSRQFHIRRFTAQSIELWPERFPASEPAPKLSIEQQREQVEQTIALATQQLQDLPVTVHLHDFHVNELQVKGKSLMQLGLQADAVLGSSTSLAQAHVLVQLQEHAVKSVELELSLSAQQQLMLSANAQSAQGQPADAIESNDQKISQWQGQVYANLDVSQQPYRLSIADTSASVTSAVDVHKFELAGQAYLMPGLVNIHQLTLEALQGSIEISGELQPKDITLNLKLSHLDIGQLLPEVEAFVLDGEVTTAGPPYALTASGLLAGKGQLQGQPIRIDARFAADGKQVDLLDLQAGTGDAHVSGTGLYSYDDRGVKANLKARGITTALVEQFGVAVPADVYFKLVQADIDVVSQLPVGDQTLAFKLEATAKGAGRYKDVPLALSLQIKGDEQTLAFNGTQVLVNQTALVLAGQVDTQQQGLDLIVSAVGFSEKTLKGLGLALPPSAQFSQDIKVNLAGLFFAPEFNVTLAGQLGQEQLVLFNQCLIRGDLQTIVVQRCAFSEKAPSLAVKNQAVMNHTGIIKLNPLDVQLDHQFQALALDRVLQVLPATLRRQWRTDQIGAVLDGKVHSSVAQKAGGIEVQQITSNLKLSGKMYQQSLKGDLQFTLRDVLSKPVLAISNIDVGYGQSSLQVKGDFVTLEQFGQSPGQSPIQPTQQSKKATENGAGNATVNMNLNALIKSKDLEHIPFELLNALDSMPGVLRFQTTLKGNTRDPQVKGSLKYQLEPSDDGTLESDAFDEELRTTIPYTLAVALDRELGDLLRLQGTLGYGQIESGFQVETNGLVQLLAQAQGGPALDPKAFMAKSKGELDLASLQVLLNPVLHQFSGLTTWQAQYKQGAFSGDVQIQKGAYEHLSMGTQLKDITLKGKFDLNGLEIVQGSAGDGAKGRYDLSGYVQNPASLSTNRTKSTRLSPVVSTLKPTNLQIRLTEVRILDRPDIELAAGGAIQLTSATVDNQPVFLVKGALALQPLTVKLDQAQTSGVSKLDVKYVPTLDKQKAEKKKAQDKKAKDKKAKGQTEVADAPAMPPIALDIALKTDQQAFLRGKGIEAELGGNIMISGTVDEPHIDGFYRILRGRAEVLGKRFILETGELRLSDGQGIINLKAVNTNRDQNFIAQVSGNLQNPQVSLTSEPPMPEDETVSRLLFGKSLGEVTAVQALKIAAAVHSLGTSGGFDPIASTRDAIGVDQVSVESETDESGASNYKVGVGKYVSDRVYVEIERSTNAIDPWQGRVEIDVTDTISVETTAKGSSGVSGVDVNWKRDY